MRRTTPYPRFNGHVKPLAEAGKNSKTVAPIVDLATQLADCAQDGADDAPAAGAKAGSHATGKGQARGGSLIGRFQLKGLVGKRKAGGK